jgi:uncharacterized protein YbcC (UPF0753/DUF2309 family)
MTSEILVDEAVNILKNNYKKTHVFDDQHTLHELKHYLPAQASLKDFIHHNTLHAFQKQKFFEGTRQASQIFGYRVSLSVHEYRQLYREGKIRQDVLEKILSDKKGQNNLSSWLFNLHEKKYEAQALPRIGALRSNWKRIFRFDLDSMVHPILFRVLCAYLDQGIAMWNFPVWQKDFFVAIQEMERTSFTSFFRGKLAKKMLLETPCNLEELLARVVGDELLFEQYLFDQQFAHPGWSGMVAVVESQPETLLDSRKISLRDLIRFELLMEIDALEYHFGSQWKPLGFALTEKPEKLFAPTPETELSEVLTLWQEAFEWSYYDDVLAGIQTYRGRVPERAKQTFQGLFCIDDRECSLRRYLENLDPFCQTFGTPGFFGVEFYFQPLDGKFYTKVCPAPMFPKYLIKEEGIGARRDTDLNFTKHSHGLFRGWLITYTLGFWDALKLVWNIFRPTMSPATATSFKHMDKKAKLTIENHHTEQKENGLQVGFTIAEMALRMENLLKSIGLVKDFAPIVYLVGHGSSSVNNPHYAAYDCGACSGRPGSVNSRVACYMANHPDVRKLLATRGIVIPDSTRFVGGLHDTTRDEVVFYDEDTLRPELLAQHRDNTFVFEQALDKNAKERSRRLVSINSQHSAEEIHEEVRTRSVSLFEPRPELNHATNTLCVVGRRSLTQGLYLDRRAFMNSYDYHLDPDGQYLLNILKPAAPVCGGINLEYFFSRTDNQKLGAGTKLPHNVMGLIGVANGIDGDLRPGLPSQMIEVHDPVRLLVIVEHHPDVVLNTLQRSPETYEWFINDWVKLVAVEPETFDLYVFDNGAFKPYQPLRGEIKTVSDLTSLFETQEDNLPVLILK